MTQYGETVSGMPYSEHESSPDEDMAAYDDLPFMLRKVIARFPAEIETPPLRALFRSGKASAIDILKELQRLEQAFYENAYEDRGIEA